MGHNEGKVSIIFGEDKTIFSPVCQDLTTTLKSLPIEITSVMRDNGGHCPKSGRYKVQFFYFFSNEEERYDINEALDNFMSLWSAKNICLEWDHHDYHGDSNSRIQYIKETQALMDT